MVQIDLTPKQVEELKNHYILELEKLQQRTSEVMGLLSRLVHGQVPPLPDTTENKKEIKKKETSIPTGKVNWTDFILQLLKDKDKPLTVDQILKEYKKQNKVTLSDPKNTLASINQTLFRLRSKQNLITSSRRKGKKGNVYSLVKQPDTAVVKAQPKVSDKKVKKEKELPSSPKSTWSQFVLDILAKQKRILSVNEFVKYAMVQFDLPATDKKVTGKRIGPVLSYMATKSKKIKSTRKAGQKGTFYGLTDWFTDKNELITIYK